MPLRLFSDKNRPVHLGPYPLERLARAATVDLSAVPETPPLEFRRPDAPASIVNAMGEYQSMMDAIRGGLTAKAQSDVPSDPLDRSNHLKAFGYFSDASMAGVAELAPAARLSNPRRNPDIDRLAHDLKTRRTKTPAPS